MNERIKDILRKSGGVLKDEDGTELPTYVLVGNAPEQFAELIVRECINQAHSVANLRGANDDMVYGADTAALQISKYFGVEE